MQTIKVGYGGYVTIKGKLVQVLSASVTRSYNISTFEPFYQRVDDSTSKEIAQAQMRACYGTCSFSGQVSFELTNNILNQLFKVTYTNQNGQNKNWTNYNDFFAKDSKFELIIHDGYTKLTLNNCMWQSISLQCQPSSLVVMSITFQSDNNGSEHFNTSDVELTKEYDQNDYLIPYWQTGAANMLSFNLTLERSVTPVYLNNNKVAPTYLRSGLISVSVNATYYKQSDVAAATSIKIGDKNITLTKTVIQQSDFKMSSFQDVGEKSIQYKSMPLEYTKPIFNIS